MATLGVSFHLLIEDQGLVLSAILVPFDSNQFMLSPSAMSFFQKLCPSPFPPVKLLGKNFPSGSVVKNLPTSAGDTRESCKGNGNPFQFSCLGNPMDRGTWQATVLILPQIKLNSQLSYCAFFSVDTTTNGLP